MNPETTTKMDWNRILDALQTFDESAAPVGLYAANEFRRPSAPEAPLLAEWELALAPAFKAAGCNPMTVSKPRLKDGCFGLQGGGRLEMCQVSRLSKIKVRKYGNGYRVDPHIDHDQRWEGFALQTRIKSHFRCWRGVVVFIGFAIGKRPFAEELAELGNTLKPTVQRFWPDPHGRGFNTFTALWTNA